MSLERLHVRVRPDQGDRLRRRALKRGGPVVQLVREAVDASLGGRSEERRNAAWARFDAMPVVAGAPDAAELERHLDDRDG